jgi:AcrR family transcriptional regulator
MTRIMAAVNRKQRALQTRERIASAAARLFAERGYDGVPMDAIAAEAGVAVQTVYFAFRTKPELLIAAWDQAVLGSLAAPPPDQQEWFRAVLDEPDPRATLRLMVDGVLAILERIGPLMPVMMSAPDPGVRTEYERREQLRYAGWRAVVDSLGKPHLKRGVTVATASDLFFALLSPAMHHVLCTTRGWSNKQYRSWVLATVEAQLLR